MNSTGRNASARANFAPPTIGGRVEKAVCRAAVSEDGEHTANDRRRTSEDYPYGSDNQASKASAIRAAAVAGRKQEQERYAGTQHEKM